MQKPEVIMQMPVLLHATIQSSCNKCLDNRLDESKITFQPSTEAKGLVFPELPALVATLSITTLKTKGTTQIALTHKRERKGAQ